MNAEGFVREKVRIVAAAVVAAAVSQLEMNLDPGSRHYRGYRQFFYETATAGVNLSAVD